MDIINMDADDLGAELLRVGPLDIQEFNRRNEELERNAELSHAERMSINHQTESPTTPREQIHYKSQLEEAWEAPLSRLARQNDESTTPSIGR